MEFATETNYESGASNVFRGKITIFFHFQKSSRKERSYNEHIRKILTTKPIGNKKPKAESWKLVFNRFSFLEVFGSLWHCLALQTHPCHIFPSQEMGKKPKPPKMKTD
jgi:hypothetical protein